MIQKLLIPLVAFLTLFISYIPSSLADDGTVCVICNEPAKVYQCRYTDLVSSEQQVNVNIKGLQFSCIQEIAEYGAHGQCAAARDIKRECNGELYQLKNHATLKITTPQKEGQDTEANTEPETVKKEPATLVDSTAETYKKTTKQIQDGLEKTTDTVKDGYEKTTSVVTDTVKSIGGGIEDAAKVTYNCLFSLFQNCSNDE